MLKLANNATSLLASSIGTGNTTLILTSGTEDLFPTLSPGDWFPVVVVDANNNHEIMRCTARSGVTLTVQRGQEGTVAKSFAAGSRVDLRVTAATINAVYDRAYHTGTQPISTVTGLQTALDSKQADLSKQVSIELGHAVSSSQPSYIDFHTLDGPSDHSARIIRNAGVDGVFGISNTGSGGILIAGGPGGVALTGSLVAVNGNAVWHAGNFAPGNYLPTAGGTMTGPISFGSATGDKLLLWGTNYGMAVLPSEFAMWAASTAAFRWRWNSSAGPVGAELTSAGFKLPTATPTDNLHAAPKQYVEQYVNLRGAKAWVNFNGTGTVAIRSAHNVSSISDLGTGTYQVNFASPMANANYCALAQSVTQGTGVQLQYQATMTDYLTTSVTVRTGQSGTSTHSIVDNEIVNVAVFGG